MVKELKRPNTEAKAKGPLADELRLLVGRHGFKAVSLELRMLKAEQRPVRQRHRDTQARAGQRNRKANAIEYVQKLDVDADKRPAVMALAERFEAKRFLPSCADIRNFCAIYDIEPPASKSRAAAIPRLFKYFAAMDAKDVERLSTDEAYSGPSELGPLAEAIRRHGRAARNPASKSVHTPTG